MSNESSHPNLGGPTEEQRRSILNANAESHPEGRGLEKFASYIVTKTELATKNKAREERGEAHLTIEQYFISHFLGGDKNKIGLELGTSTGGVFMREASPYVAHMDGISNGITEEEIGKIEQACVNCDVRLADAGTLPYEDNRFDFIFGVEIHRYFKAQDTYKEAREYFLKVVNEIYRTLKPGGIAVLSPAHVQTYRPANLADLRDVGGFMDSTDLTEEERALLPPGIQMETMKDAHFDTRPTGAGYRSSIRIRKPG